MVMFIPLQPFNLAVAFLRFDAFQAQKLNHNNQDCAAQPNQIRLTLSTYQHSLSAAWQSVVLSWYLQLWHRVAASAPDRLPGGPGAGPQPSATAGDHLAGVDSKQDQ